VEMNSQHGEKAMTTNQRQAKDEVLSLMRDVQTRYFPELQCLFEIEGRADIDGVEMRVVFGAPATVYLYYSDDRILSYQYRAGLIPVIAHELAHIISPVDPEAIMKKRLPEPMMNLWLQLRERGHAQCSMDARN